MNRGYYRSYRRPRRSGGSKVFGLGVFVLAVFLAFGGIVWFRNRADTKKALEMTEVQQTQELLFLKKEAPPERSREEVLLTDSGGGSQTIASREIEDHVFRHTIVAHLSDPPGGSFYEGWLLREDPFDFFSTGRMDPNADGTYALIWEGERGRDYIDYTNIIITLEKDDGDASPSATHVLEGVFSP